MSNPTADCEAILHNIGISLSFSRSGSPAYHYEKLWWLYAHGKGGEKPDETVYKTVVLPALKAARKQARGPAEKALLLHESGAIDLYKLYGAHYSNMRDSEATPGFLEAFGDLTGTTPEQLAKSILQAADRCELALVADMTPGYLQHQGIDGSGERLC